MGNQLVRGYCTWCAENTVHGYYAKSPMSAVAHKVTRMFAGSHGYGPWYCSACRRITNVIAPPVDERSEASGAGEQSRREQSAAVAPPDVPQASDAKRPLVEPKAKKPSAKPSSSSSPSSRYSKKYRFAVARRIIEGGASFKQIGEELSLSKREIWGWLVEHFHDSQQQITQLKKQVRLLEGTAGDRQAQPTTEQQVVSGNPDANSDWSTTVVVDAQQMEDD